MTDGAGSWLFARDVGGSTAPADPWTQVAALAPDVFAALDGIQAATDAALPHSVVALCRARMAMLLGVPITSAGEPKVAMLAQWPTSGRFDERERACLAVAEQFVMDVTAVSQEHIDAVLAHFTPPEAVALLHMLWFEEAMLRLGLVLGVQRPEAAATDSARAG